MNCIYLDRKRSGVFNGKFYSELDMAQYGFKVELSHTISIISSWTSSIYKKTYHSQNLSAFDPYTVGWEIPGCSFPCVICLKVQFFCKSCLKSGLRAYVQFLSISFRHSLRMGFLKIHGAQCHRSAVFHVFHHLLPITDPIGYWKFVYNTARRPTFHHWNSQEKSFQASETSFSCSNNYAKTRYQKGIINFQKVEILRPWLITHCFLIKF